MSTNDHESVRIVVVLGGYGNFGAPIVEALAKDSGIQVLVAGRDAVKARRLCERIGGNTRPWQVDCYAPSFSIGLRERGASILIHTAGPFQDQDYAVAKACIEAKCHYIDIADSRRFVVDINGLSDAARDAGVCVISGASSVPALSSAVVDHLASGLQRVESIDHAISSGAKPPGIATMRGVLSYVGKPFSTWKNDAWRTTYGWQAIRLYRYPSEVGLRLIAACNVPDLELFPKRYPAVGSVTFRAGVGFLSTTMLIWAMSWLVRSGFLADLSRYSELLHRLAAAIERVGSRWSAMHVRIVGNDVDGRSVMKSWTLIAGDNHGPMIPCCPSIALTRKFLRGDIPRPGAQPCVGLLRPEEILNAISNLNLRALEETTPAVS